MVYPPTPPPNNRTNATVTVDNHPGDHNDVSDALTDIIAELGNDPKGSGSSVEDRLDTMDTTIAAKVPKSDYDANTILKADSDNTPVALTVAEQRLVGRITAGVITALTAAEVRTLLDVAAVGDVVLKSLYDANTILAANTDNTPAALTVAEQTLVGRVTSGSIDDLSASQVRTMLDVPTTAEAILDTIIDAKGDLIVGSAADTPSILTAGANGEILAANSAEATGLEWIAAPGGGDLLAANNLSDVDSVSTSRTNLDVPSNSEAVLDTLFDANTIIKADTDNTPEALTVGEQTFVGRITGGEITALTPSQGRTLFDVSATGDVVLKSLYDANTILTANSDNTPAALTVAEQTLVGRVTAGSIDDLSVSAVRTMLDVPTNSEAILKTIIDAKGDLIVGTAADTPARLAVGGTNGHVLTVDSAEATGMKWAAAAGGGGAEMLNSQGSVVGTVGTGEDTLWTYTMPGGTLAADGDMLQVSAWVSFTAETNTTTMGRYYFGTEQLGFSAPDDADYNGRSQAVFSILRTSATTVTVAYTATVKNDDLETVTFDATTDAVTQTLSSAIDIKFTGEVTEVGGTAVNDQVECRFASVMFIPAA